MPRKRIPYTHIFPYHLTARSNNKEWFYLPKDDVWKIIVSHARHAHDSDGLLIHALVLMDNHYHMIATASEAVPLGSVMQNFQKRISREINSRASRINHVFGGPYKPSLITNEAYYARAIKYLYQNPVVAGICSRVEEYEFSTLNRCDIPICSPVGEVGKMLPQNDFINWLNRPFDIHELIQIEKGLMKTVFKLSQPRKNAQSRGGVSVP